MSTPPPPLPRPLHGLARSALRCAAFVHQLEVRLQESVLGDPPLMAKVLRLAGDILWKLGRERESVRNYLRCLDVVAEAEENQDATHEER